MDKDKSSSEGYLGLPLIEVPYDRKSSVPPKNHKAEIIKSWASVIATLAALITSVAALLKPPSDDVQIKTIIITLSDAVKAQTKDIKENHDDIVALKSYLDGYLRGTNTLPVSQSGSGGSLPLNSAANNGAGQGQSVTLVPLDKSKIKVTSRLPGAPVDPKTIIVVPTSKAPPLPTMHGSPESYLLPNTDGLLK